MNHTNNAPKHLSYVIITLIIPWNIVNIFRWFAHSEDDNVVGVEETDKLVGALQKEGNIGVMYVLG